MEQWVFSDTSDANDGASMMTGRDSDQQQPGRWGSSKFIIVLSVLVAAALVGSFVSKTGTNPANAPPSSTAAPNQGTAAPESKVQTTAGSSKDQPADSPKP